MVRRSTVLSFLALSGSIGLLVPLVGWNQADSLNSLAAAEKPSQHNTESSAADPANKGTQQSEIATIIEVNSKVLDEIGKIATLMEESTDMIMRFNHFTDGHTKPVKLCPECWPAPEPDDTADIEESDEKIPETMVQLLKDSNELHMSMRRLRGHLSSQQFALKRHLMKLRAGKLEGSNAAPESD